ncbi:MAG TPA: ATP-binding cassette domain-containing protein, partial [Candidatus Flavonifractor merdigallinarum]|nr:ATP-binding cassette domain-containing protein [Candidatus Flavonifractor merdigallinarum]
MIDVKNLSKSFGDHLVLDNISEHISPGEKVVVIGPSGSGKSTFLRCLNLLETPTKGTITFDGQEVTDPKANIDKIRQQMGMVFQHFNLFPNMTIRKNITLAPVRTKLMGQAEADDTATALLKRVGLSDKADAYPAQLSGGQKQRIVPTHALYANEPSSILVHTT